MVLLWTTFATKDTTGKATVELLATRIDSGDLLLPAKEVCLVFYKTFMSSKSFNSNTFILLLTECTCGNPPTIQNGFSNPNRGPLNCGSSVDYSCNSGYNLQGNTRVFCDQNGQWGSTPSCQQSKTFV